MGNSWDFHGSSRWLFDWGCIPGTQALTSQLLEKHDAETYGCEMLFGHLRSQI